MQDTSESGFAQSSTAGGRKNKRSSTRTPVKGILKGFFAVALLLGTIAGSLGALALAATPAGASTPPTVTAVSPNNGPVAGGTSVVITGTGFDSTSVVDFGSNAATGVVVNSPTQITATSPAGTPSLVTVDITVTTSSGGQSATSSADQFQYAVNELEDCYATTSEGDQAASSNRQLVAYSTPTSVLPGGDFTETYADPGTNSVPATSGTYGISGITDSVLKLDVPANTTVTSGPTVTQEGYYYAPPSGAQTPMPATVTLISDSATPAGPSNTQNNGQEIEISIPENIPGGDNYVMPTVTIGLQASSAPTSDSLSSGVLTVLPAAGANTSTDPGDVFTITVTGTPVGNVAADTSCWPFPSPQPPFVSTGVIDAVPPAITIASPGNATQVVQNAHVAAAFGCVDPPVWGNGIASCTATNDGSPIANGALINTSTLGAHSLTVNASNNSGTTSTQTSNYTVIAPPYNLIPPTVSLTSPTNGAQYITGSVVDANYSCTAASGTTTCNGYNSTNGTSPVANGAPISTTAGYHTFTVSALDSRGNPTNVTVGYYARTSNSPSTTSTHQSIAYSASPSNSDCALGTTYYSITFSSLNSSETCNSSTDAEIDTAVTAPAANGGQLAVGDNITVQQQVYKPGYQATAAKGGYYSGPYATNFTLSAPANTAINGPITSSPTGLASSTFGGTASASAASACNFGATGTVGTGACSSTPAGNVASTTATATGSTTVGAYGSTTAGAQGSTTVGAYGSTTVGTLFSTTVAAASNAGTVGSGDLHVASITSAPTSGHLEVASSAGTAVIAYTGTSTSTSTCGASAEPCFTGVSLVSGSGTMSTGGAVNQPLTVGNGTVLPVAATTGFKTSGTNQVNVTTSAGTATLQYTGSSTTAGTCGTTPCLTGVTLVSGSGTIAKGNAVFQTPFSGTGVLPATTVTGFTTTGNLNVTLSNGPAVVAYTGTSTTAATCGAAACFTGVTLTSGSGTAAAGAAISQVAFSGTGVLPAAAVTGFTTAGNLNITLGGSPAVVAYTGTSTTAGTCGAAACFTGVTLTSGSGSGASGAITQVVPDVGTFTGAGVIPAASVSGFTTSGSVNAPTSNGAATFTYTGTSTTAGTCGAAACFTGVTTQNGATGTLTTGGAITQNLSNVNTYSGASLAITSSTGFLAPGEVSVATSGGTAYLSFTGTGTGTLTGVTYDGGASGTVTPGGAVTQAGGLTQNLDAFTQIAAGSNGVDVSTLTGSGTVSLASTSATPFTAPGTVEVDTSNGVQDLNFTQIQGTTLTGVSVANGGSGVMYTGGLVGQAAPTATQGASVVNGQNVSGYNWSVNANHQSSVGITWDDSSCQNAAGQPAATSPSSNDGTPCTSPEIEGMDGSYIYLQYTLTVTQAGTITLPGLPSLNATTSNNCYSNSDDSGTCWGTNPFVTTAAAAPGISYTAVDASPPAATLNAPIQGAVYSYGQTVDANYSCTEPTSGVTITSCTGVEDAGTSFQQSVASGSPLNTTDLVPNQIHTFTVTATNSEGYTDISYATFIALANPPTLANQTVNAPVGQTTAIPFNYSGSYPANLSTEQIVTPPQHGTVAIQPNGSFLYTNDNSTNATDSFQWTVGDTADNPGNIETVNINITDTNNPTVTFVTPPADGTGSYAYQSTVDANYSCGDLVTGGIISCTASQDVNGTPTNVPDGSPIDTSSLIVGNTHSLTVTAENFFGLTTTSTADYTVNTPAPVANNDSATTINPNPVIIPVLNNDTSIFPLNPSTVSVVSNPTYGTTTVEPSGAIKYTPTSASSTAVTHDSFEYTVEDTDGQVSNEATVDVTIYPIPVVSGVSPIAGPDAGGTAVTITGTGFATATAVNFGDTPAESFTINSNTSITADAPTSAAGAAGAFAGNTSADITVVAPGGTSSTSAADVYNWDPVPTLSGISPKQGIVAGGTTLTVDGSGFTEGTEGATSVNLVIHNDSETVACTNVTVNADGNSLTCTTGQATEAGVYDVIVSTPGGTTTSIPADYFTYFYPAPSITSVSPSSGSPAGGTSVTITGNSFSGATSVSFGAQPAEAFTVNSNSSITATAPAGTPGSRVDITVTGPGGTSTTLPADQFTYGPEVTGVTPNSGPQAGGTSVNISGSGFTNAVSVSFDGSATTDITVNSDTSITAIAPPGAGTVDVTVTTPDGTSPTSSSDLYTYLAPVPVVSAVSPNNGPVGGGTPVTITGNGFTGATTVSFGGSPASNVTVVSNTSITATSPAGSAGTVDVTVTSPGGTSATSANDHFTYGPQVTTVSPKTGSTAGGTSVTITGSGLTGATAVHFGANAATNVVVNSATSVTATSPAGAAGTINVTVTTPSGTSPIVGGDTFTYSTSTPTVSGVSPNNGPTAGGTTVTITGNGFTGATGVNFGGSPATGVVVKSNTSITAVSPSGTAATTVNVTVTGPGGTSSVVTADQFTYGPTVTNISPTSGPIAGGTKVTITGTNLTGATAVDFGSTPGTGLVVNSNTSVTVTSPAGAAGPVNVTVVTPSGTTPVSSGGVFTYTYPVPSIGSVSPNVGAPGGGTSVTITGSGFTNATTVSFGANPGTSLVVNSSTSITVTSPAGTPVSTVDITVTGPGGTSAITTADKFTYGPVVTSVSPNTGSHLGGTTVTIKGAGFTGTTAVNFGSTAVTSGITVNSAGTQITVAAPAHAAGSVDVTVTAGGNTSATNASETFTYV